MTNQTKIMPGSDIRSLQESENYFYRAPMIWSLLNAIIILIIGVVIIAGILVYSLLAITISLATREVPIATNSTAKV